MTLVWSSSINCKRFLYFPYGPSQQWLPVCHNKQPLPSIIYLPDPLSLHRYVWDIFHIQWRFGDGGGHQPVGLNAGIVYNSDPTSRISNYILICIQPNIWRLSGEYISTSVCRNIRIYLRQTPFGQKISSYSGTLQKSTIKPAEHRGFSLMKRVPFIYSWKISDSKAYQTGRVDKAWGNWKRRGGGRCSEAALKALL